MKLTKLHLNLEQGGPRGSCRVWGRGQGGGRARVRLQKVDCGSPREERRRSARVGRPRPARRRWGRAAILWSKARSRRRSR